VTRVCVVGSVNTDLTFTVDTLPRPGETALASALASSPGGKGANQAVAAAKLGGSTALIGRLGKDAFGTELRAFLEAQAVDVSLVADTTDAHTGTAIITLANADNTIVVIPGANGLLSTEDVVQPALAKGDVAVSQFEIPLLTIKAFFQKARAVGALTILNPAPAQPCDTDLLDLVDILVLNETELALLTGRELREPDDTARFVDAARSLQADPAQAICVTLGKRGAVALVGDEVMTMAGHSVKAVDTTGAGDCFVGALAAQLALGAAIRDALGYANTAASISVQRMGAAPSMPWSSNENSRSKPTVER